MKLVLLFLVSAVAFHSAKAEVLNTDGLELIEKFRNEKNLPEPAVNFLCLLVS